MKVCGDLGGHLLAKDDDRGDDNDDALDVVTDRVSDGRDGVEGEEGSLIVELRTQIGVLGFRV